MIAVNIPLTSQPTAAKIQRVRACVFQMAMDSIESGQIADRLSGAELGGPQQPLKGCRRWGGDCAMVWVWRLVVGWLLVAGGCCFFLLGVGRGGGSARSLVIASAVTVGSDSGQIDNFGQVWLKQTIFE